MEHRPPLPADTHRVPLVDGSIDAWLHQRLSHLYDGCLQETVPAELLDLLGEYHRAH